MIGRGEARTKRGVFHNRTVIASAGKRTAVGFTADMDYEGRSLKAQMRSANRVKAPWVVIIGGDEPFDSLRSLTVDWRRGC